MTSVPLFIVFMRFWGYVGVQLTSIITPLLIYKITGSLSLAGLSLLIEWVPKLYFYLYGGKLMAKIGSQRSHYIFDSARVVGFALLCVAWYSQVWLCVSLGAALIQIANAFSNIMFEGVASAYALKGQVKIRQADLSSGFLMLPLTYLLPTESLLVLGMIIYLGSLLMIKYMKPYYVNVASRAVPVSDSLAFIASHRSLGWLMFAGLALAVPISMIGATFPFFVSEANPLWVVPFSLAVITTTNNMLRFGTVSCLKKDSQWLPVLGLSMFVVGVNVSLFTSGVWILVGFSIISCGGELFRTWMRTARQDIIPQTGRLALTGVMTSFDAFSYVISAIFLALSDLPVRQNLAVVATIGLAVATVCLSVFLVRRRGRQIVWMPESLVENSDELSKAA